MVLITSVCYSQSRQFQHITSEDGISQSEVYTFLKDSQGYMWFGTVDGLNQYDGYTITTFNSNNSNHNSIPNNTIRSLDEDRFKRIWIGTDDGLCFYDMKSEQIFRCSLPGYENVRLSINKVLVNGDQLFIGTNMGLLVMNLSDQEEELLGESVHLLAVNGKEGVYDVVDCIRDHNENIWVAGSSHLYRLGQDEGKLILEEEIRLNEWLKNTRKLTEDLHGNLWIVSYDNGFIRYEPKSKEVKQFLHSSSNSPIHTNKISSVVIDNSGNLWVGSHNQGILFLDHTRLNDDNPEFDIIKHNPFDDRSLNSNLVYSLYVSNDNLIWIGTIGAGINIFDPNRASFDYYNLQNDQEKSTDLANFVRAVYSTSEDDIWIGTHNDGLLELTRNKQARIKQLGFNNQSVFHIAGVDAENTLVCTELGISVVKKTYNSLQVISTLNLGPSFYVSPIYNDICWVATLYGVYKCKYSNGKLIQLDHFSTDSSPSLSLNNCRVLFFSKQTKQLFVGTEGGGLNVLDLDENQNPIRSHVYQKSQTENSLSNNYIRSLIQSKNGDIWVGTYEGLNQFSFAKSLDNTGFKVYTTNDGLPNNTVQSLIEDNQGQLWIGTNKGLCKFDPEKNLFSYYSVNDGIQSSEFSEHAVFKKEDGEIIIGGINGINTFYPDKIKIHEFKPNTTLTNFYLFNKEIVVNKKTDNNKKGPLKKSISITDTIFLAPNQNSFGFDFSALVYNSPDKINYAYKLDGFDQDWSITPANNRKVNYTNLGYGDYAFNVKASNNEGVWENTPAYLFVSIKTPFYLTIWAYLLYGLLLASGLFFFTNYSILKYTTKEKILLDNKHNQKMRELEELRTRFFINTSHELRTPLTLISSPVQQLLRENDNLSPSVKKDLKLVERNTNKLKELVNNIMDLSKLESNKLELFEDKILIVSFLNRVVNNYDSLASHLGIKYDHSIDLDKDTVALIDAGKLEKIINNLLSNAIKHTPSGGEVTLNASLINEELIVKVIDTGKGISNEDQLHIFNRYYQTNQAHSDLQGGTGIGLALVKELTHLLNGTIEVESTLGEGSIFTLVLPFQSVSDVVNDDQIQILNSEEEIDELEYLHATPVNAFEKKHTVLIVEDNRDMQQFINRLLSNRYHTKLANHGKDALDVLSKETIHLVVSDVMMPEMDGYSLLEEVKNNKELRKIPFIILTALNNEDHRLKALTLGVDDYLGKPFLPEELLARTHNLLERYEERISFKIDEPSQQKEVTQQKVSSQQKEVTQEKEVTNIFEEEHKNTLTQAKSEAEKDWVQKVETIMREELENPDFNISDLAGQLFLSDRQFQRRMKQLTGLTPKKFQIEVALQTARELLERGAYGSVKAISFSVGMSNVWRFSQLYEARFGKKPSTYFEL